MGIHGDVSLCNRPAQTAAVRARSSPRFDRSHKKTDRLHFRMKRLRDRSSADTQRAAKKAKSSSGGKSAQQVIVFAKSELEKAQQELEQQQEAAVLEHAQALFSMVHPRKPHKKHQPSGSCVLVSRLVEEKEQDQKKEGTEEEQQVLQPQTAARNVLVFDKEEHVPDLLAHAQHEPPCLFRRTFST